MKKNFFQRILSGDNAITVGTDVTVSMDNDTIVKLCLGILLLIIITILLQKYI